MSANGTHNGTVHEQLVGIAEQVNDKGVKVGGAWRNYSKFAPGLVPPQRGARVTVRLDGQGFVRGIEAADAVLPIGDTAPSRDTLIVRQCVLKVAAEFCASRPDTKTADLFALAARMEQWVTRD